MSKKYIIAVAATALVLSSCAKNEDTPAVKAGEVAEPEVLAIEGVIDTWKEDESFRTLTWNADPSSKDANLVPRVKYTQAEFNGPLTDLVEDLTTGEDQRNHQASTYRVSENRINPEYTEVSVKLRRTYAVAQGSDPLELPKAARQMRVTAWNGREFNSGVSNGSRAIVTVINGANGKQNLRIHLPMNAIRAMYGAALFDGDWYMAVALGGHAGGHNNAEGLNQYYGVSGNGDIHQLVKDNTDQELLFYQRIGSMPAVYRDNGTGGLGNHPSFTEPNRYYFPKKDEFASYFGSSKGPLFGTTPRTGNPSEVEARRRGIGLQEQKGNSVTMKRHFPMISRFVKLTTSGEGADAAVGDNKKNYASVHGFKIEPRGTILAFKLKNTLDKPIRVKSVTGNHGGTFEQQQMVTNDRGGIVLKQRSYRAISYQGAYMMGYWGDASYGGFTEADLIAGKQAPFVGATVGPEVFPLIAEDGTEGIVIPAGGESEGRFYLWFSADPGAQLTITPEYEVLDATGKATGAAQKAKAQRANNVTDYKDGFVYGALIPVKL